MSLREELLQKPLTEGVDTRETVSPDRGVSLREQLLSGTKQPEVLKEEGGDSSFFRTLFREPIELGKTLAMTPWKIRDYIESEQRRGEMFEKLTDKVRKGEFDEEQMNKVKRLAGEDIPEMPAGIQKNTKQIIGDVAGTLLWVAPIQEIKILKGLTTVSRLGRGAALGSSFAVAAGLSEDVSNEELAKRFALGAAIGGPIEFATPWVFKGLGKAFQMAAKPIKYVGKRIIPKGLLPVETRLRMLGPHGEELADRFLASDEKTLVKCGKRLSVLEESKLATLTDDEAYTLQDALQGRLKLKQLSPNVKKVFEAVDLIRKEIGQEAADRGLTIRVLGRKGWNWKDIAKKIETGEIDKITFKEDLVLTPAGKIKSVPFIPRKNYYPQFTYDINKLQKGKLREEMLDNSVRMGRFKTREEAEFVLDSYIEFVNTNGRGGEYWVDYLIKTGQAKSEVEAKGITIRFFKPSRNQRYGHLEAARELDFPFYDPDPRRTIPMYIMGATQRLEKVAEFGQGGKEISALLGKLHKQLTQLKGFEEGRALTDEARNMTDKIFGKLQYASSRQKASLFLRTLQTPKLAFAQIVNAGQSLNTLLATDLPSLAKGLQLAFTHEGQRQALRTGATLESVLREMRSLVGSESSFANTFLKLTGFSWTEKFNRTVAANAGMTYAERLERKLFKNPADETVKRLMQEIRLSPTKILKDGFIQPDDLLRAGQMVSTITQFRARAIDLPAIVASPEGKVIFQFKNFAYNQSRFLKNQLVKELKAKNFGRAARALFIFSTVFPMTGEVTGDIRSLLTGSKRPTKFLWRYIDNIALVGGMGIMSDLLSSAHYDQFVEGITGPTVATFGRAVEELTQIATTGKVTESQWRFILRQPGITRPLVNYLIPYDDPNRKTILDSLK